MVLINMVNPSYIKQVLEGEVLREMRELLSGGEMDDSVRNNVHSLFQVIDAIENARLYGEEEFPPVDIKWKIENFIPDQVTPFQSAAMKEYTSSRAALRDNLIKEYEENAEEILNHNHVAMPEPKEADGSPDGLLRSMRLTKENFDAVADVFEIDREELQHYLVAPSATPKYVVGVGMGVYQVWKARDFRKTFAIDDEQDNGLLFVHKK